MNAKPCLGRIRKERRVTEEKKGERHRKRKENRGVERGTSLAPKVSQGHARCIFTSTAPMSRQGDGIPPNPRHPKASSRINQSVDEKML